MRKAPTSCKLMTPLTAGAVLLLTAAGIIALLHGHVSDIAFAAAAAGLALAAVAVTVAVRAALTDKADGEFHRGYTAATVDAFSADQPGEGDTDRFLQLRQLH